MEVAEILIVNAKERTHKPKRMGELASKVAEKLGTKCFRTKIRESVVCTEALTEYYVLLSKYAPDSTTNTDSKNFVSELRKELAKWKSGRASKGKVHKISLAIPIELYDGVGFASYFFKENVTAYINNLMRRNLERNLE